MVKAPPTLTNNQQHMVDVLFHQNPDAVFAMDTNGNFLSVNDAFVRLGECNHDVALNTGFLAFLPFYEIERVTNHFRMAVAGEVQRYETDVVTAKGNRLHLSITNFPIVVDAQIAGVYGTARDITALKQKESELKQSEDKYRSIIENALSGFILSSPDGIIVDANKTALDMLGYTYEEITRMKRAEVIDVDDPKLLELINIRNELGYAKGELTALTKMGKRIPCEFSSVIFRDINGNERASTNMIDISERKVAEAEIYNKQKLLNAIVDKANEGIAVVDTDGRFLIFNDSMAQLLGAPRIDSKNYNWSNIYHICDPKTGKPTRKDRLPIVRALGGEEIKNELFLVENPERGNVYLSISSSAIRDKSGQIVASMVIDRDVTEEIANERKLKKAIADLQASNQRFLYATRATSDAIWDWSMDTGDLHWGEGFQTLFGYEVGDGHVNISCWEEHIHSDDKERVLKKIIAELAAKDSQVWQDEYRYLRADGSVAQVIDRGLIVRDDTGKAIRMIGAMQDVSQLRAHEAALLESNERFTYAAQATSEAIWEWNAGSPEHFKEYGYFDLFGYQLENNIGGVDFWFSKVHPEDRDKIWQQMVTARTDPKENKWTLEYRFRRADGVYIYLKEKAILLRDEFGNLLRMIGSMQDITRQKKEEERLRLMDSVLTHSTDSVIVTTTDELDQGRTPIVYVNKAFTKLTEYTPEEAIGQTPDLLHGPNTDKVALQSLFKLLRQRETVETELINYSKSGREYWAQISIAPLADHTGKVTHFIGIQRDVTERKNHELEKEKLIRELTQKIKDLKQFTYITSHNLRSPIANLLGLINLAEEVEVEDETLSAILNGVKSSSESLNATIKDLLYVLDTKENQFIQKEPNHIPEIWAHVSAQVSNLIADVQPEIILNFEVCSTIPFHKVYMESILLNLLTNAIKYRSPERKLKINVSTRTNGGKCQLIFSDNGIGLDVERHKDRIFGFYQKFHNNPDSKGLGLYLIKSQMEDLGGTVELESAPDKGAMFTLTFAS